MGDKFTLPPLTEERLEQFKKDVSKGRDTMLTASNAENSEVSDKVKAFLLSEPRGQRLFDKMIIWGTNKKSEVIELTRYIMETISEEFPED